MTPELTDDDKAILAELLREMIARDRFPVAACALNQIPVNLRWHPLISAPIGCRDWERRVLPPVAKGRVTEIVQGWECGPMLTSEERALVIEQQDRLIELLTERQESSKAEDWDRVRELQTGIDDAQGQLEIIRQLDDAVPG